MLAEGWAASAAAAVRHATGVQRPAALSLLQLCRNPGWVDTDNEDTVVVLTSTTRKIWNLRLLSPRLTLTDIHRPGRQRTSWHRKQRELAGGCLALGQDLHWSRLTQVYATIPTPVCAEICRCNSGGRLNCSRSSGSCCCCSSCWCCSCSCNSSCRRCCCSISLCWDFSST